MYQFTDDCLVGVPELDEDHRHLFDALNTAHDRMDAGDPPHDIAVDLIEGLKEYSTSHFIREEAYMKRIHDPEYKFQVAEHKAFKARIDQIDFSKLGNEQAEISLNKLLEYLSRWLFCHILGSDIMIGHFESPFSFTEKYHTGVELLDDEHEKLFSIIEEAHDLVHDQLLHDKYDEIVRIGGELKEYTQIHFHDEEAYMEQIGYPHIAEQKKAHAVFIEHINEIDMETLENAQHEYLVELISFLINWLSFHILEMDKHIGEYAARVGKN